MNGRREQIARSLGHRLASEVHRALADADMSVADLSKKIGESQAFIRRVLQGEDGIAETVKLKFLADVAWATGQWLSIAVSSAPPVKSRRSVQ